MAPKKKSQKTNNGPSIFDYIKALTSTKEDLTTHPEFQKTYNPFMINRWLSMDKSLVYAAFYGDQILNYVSKELHFKFLLNIIEKGHVYIQYKKPAPVDPSVKLISDYYDVSESEAKEIVYILSAEQIKIIENSFGGRKG